MSGLRIALALHLSDTAAENNSVGALPRQSDSANGARPKNGMHLQRKYGLVALEEPEGGQANVRTWARGDGHRYTRGTEEEGRTETTTGTRLGSARS